MGVQKAMSNTTTGGKVKGVLFLIAGFILLVVTFWAAAIIIRDVTPNVVRRFFDRPVLDFILDLRSPSLTSLMKFFTLFGSTAFGVIALIVMAVVSFVVSKDIRFPIFFVLVLAGAFWIDDLVKQMVSLPRPPVRRLVDASGPSFPSGHAAAAGAVAYAIAFFVIERQPTRSFVWVWPTMTVVAALVGLSRCYLGVAWPTDVLAGFLLGVGYGMVVGTSVKTFFGYQRLWPRRARG
jgi:undecaprenyl-diphosphatase